VRAVVLFSVELLQIEQACFLQKPPEAIPHLLLEPLRLAQRLNQLLAAELPRKLPSCGLAGPLQLSDP
jgi:hypothetical protein